MTLTNRDIIASAEAIAQARSYSPAVGQKPLPAALVYALRFNAWRLEGPLRAVEEARDDIIRQHGGRANGTGGYAMTQEQLEAAAPEIATLLRQVVNVGDVRQVSFSVLEGLSIPDAWVPLWMVEMTETNPSTTEATITNGKQPEAHHAYDQS